LDVGGGCGDAAHFWTSQYDLVERVTSVNLSAEQCAVGRQRFDCVQFVVGDASSLASIEELQSCTFDKVIALDACYHFEARTEFFAQSFDLLEKGGKLVLSDIVLPPGVGGWKLALLRVLVGGFHMPTRNLITQAEYLAQLESSGFHQVRAKEITASVYRPLSCFLEKHISELGTLLSATTRAKFLIFAALLRWITSYQPPLLGYVVFSCQKPL